jgi:hypothetical protein
MVRIGTLQISSGAIGAYDFGWSGEDFRPLGRSVPLGEHLVEIAVADRLVVAARVTFDQEGKGTEWRPAVRVDNESHVVGVDTANVSFFDAKSFMMLEAREQERRYEEGVIEHSPLGAKFVHLKAPKNQAPDCVVITSGMGDGGYPCYWGLDQNGAIVSLVVDFLVVAEFLNETVSLEWSTVELNKTVGHPILEEYKIEAGFYTTGISGFKVHGEKFEHARLLSADGKVLFDSLRCGHSQSGEESFYYWEMPESGIDSATLEIVISTGHRN